MASIFKKDIINQFIISSTTAAAIVKTITIGKKNIIGKHQINYSRSSSHAFGIRPNFIIDYFGITTAEKTITNIIVNPVTIGQITATTKRTNAPRRIAEHLIRLDIRYAINATAV